MEIVHLEDGEREGRIGLRWIKGYTKAVRKVRGLTLLIRVRTSSRCGDGLFFEVPSLESDALHTMLHPLLENVLRTVCRKFQGSLDLSRSFLRF